MSALSVAENERHDAWKSLGALLRSLFESKQEALGEAAVPMSHFSTQTLRRSASYFGMVCDGKNGISYELLQTALDALGATDEQRHKAVWLHAAGFPVHPTARPDLLRYASTPARRLHAVPRMARHPIPWENELRDDPTFMDTWRVVGSIYMNRRTRPQAWNTLLAVLKSLDPIGTANIPPEDTRRAGGRGPSNL